MNIPLIITQEQNCKILLDTLTKQSDNHFEDNKHNLHIIYDKQEFIISPLQAQDLNIIRGVMLSIIMTKSAFADKLSVMIEEERYIRISK